MIVLYVGAGSNKLVTGLLHRHTGMIDCHGKQRSKQGLKIISFSFVFFSRFISIPSTSSGSIGLLEDFLINFCIMTFWVLVVFF